MLGLFVAPRVARATYSIVAADTALRATGGAGTSCVEGQDVYLIHGVVPGTGTLHAQAVFNPDALSRGVDLLAAGSTPLDVVQAITVLDFDPHPELRQYGIADVFGRTAAFTGASNSAYAGDRQGEIENIVYSVQGNILTSRAVVDRAADAFESAGCDLAERLMRALEAGALNGEGDSRCTASRGIPSDSAFLEVDGADGSSVVLRVPTSGDANPLTALRQQYDTWRQDHPCAPPDAGAAAGPRSDAHTEVAGCGCHLPRGRNPGALSLAAMSLAGLVGARRRPRRVPSAVFRQ